MYLCDKCGKEVDELDKCLNCNDEMCADCMDIHVVECDDDHWSKQKK